ncbi:hypothetical protein [Leptolyngbya iicbica]|uniref:Uncharacterized protein n=2 Tax=Cyanophyceae TaxID=3028117 RepID=A0A4V2E2N6_9CYAN|nr:hypothetical protein [Leptolyngbya sp. LK]RZM79186.1 hypothetical protein DYY88_10540 [Leptolyngbya sp. LK]
MIPPGHHLKTRLEKDAPSKPKPDLTFITVRTTIISISIALTISIPITIKLFESLLENLVINLGEQSSDEIPDPLPEATPDTPPKVTLDSSPKVTLDPLPEVPPESSERFSQNRVCIPNSCNGKYAGSANFREAPSLSTLVIKGVIPVGECVFLTGNTAHGDNVIWHEAINETFLRRSLETAAKNQLSANQLGWIADCFIE